MSNNDTIPERIVIKAALAATVEGREQLLRAANHKHDRRIIIAVDAAINQIDSTILILEKRLAAQGGE